MFNPLTRALKLGLTAITILTAGGFAGTAFAQVTSGYWLSQSGAVLFPSGYPHYNQFLFGTVIPTANGLHNGDVSIPPIWHNLSLNLGTTTFKGRALGGSSADGVGYFSGRVGTGVRWYDYAGLFHTTDLGAPITGRTGKASWVGKFQAVNYARTEPAGGPGKDFVLEVDYTNQKLNAFVQSQYVDWYIKIDARYNNRGLITGDVEYSKFYSKDRDRRRQLHLEGRVSGLIGVQGAVGAFISKDSYSGYSGGFVARPAGDVSGAQAFLNTTCNRNPFDSSSKNQEFCRVEYENERRSDISNCLQSDGSLGSDSKCTRAARYNSCINDPFASKCTTDPDFKDFYVSARANRLGFCIRINSATNSLCRSTRTVAAVCAKNLFVAVCLNNRSYDPNRASVIASCNTVNGRYASSCRTSSAITAICNNNLFGVGCLTHSRYNPNRASVIASCNTVNGRYASACRTSSAITAICNNNLFGVGCLTHSRYNPNRASVIASCNTVNGRYASACRTSSAITAICNNNLFGVGCLTHSRYNPNRAAVITSCNTEGGKNASACRTPDAVTAICADNLFGVGCLTHSSYADARTTSLDVCNIANNSGNPLCMNTNLDNICSYAPFAALCLNRLDLESEEVLAKFTTCRAANSSDLTCHGVNPELKPSERKPNTATWVDSFVTKSSPSGPPSVADTIMRSQFLKGGETDLDQAAIPRVREPDELYLNADNFDDSLELLTSVVPTDTTDGVAFAFGRNSLNQRKFYAGILSGTDLGEPITGIYETKAVWEGTFQSVWVATKAKFDLEITFGNNKTGSIKAFIERKTSSKFYSTMPHFYLDGTFDGNGLITGRVIAGEFEKNETLATGVDYPYPGILRGLIGEEGAVGAFVGGTSTDKGNTITGTSVFSGGFVARVSTVDYADWAGAAAPLDAIGTTTGNQFLSGELLDSLTRSTTKLNLRHATYNGYLLNGDSRDGVAFFKNQPTTGQASYYAGIFSGTDLGAPVTQTGKSAYWSGRFQVAHNDAIAPSVGFVLRVNFGNAGDKAGSISSLVKNAVGTTPVALEGRFTYKGVITGTARLNGSLGTTSGSMATMKGLIGQDGTVGVFIADDGQTPFSGGFVARPHSVNIRDLQNYATLQTSPSGLVDSGGFLRGIPSLNGQLDDNRGHFPSTDFYPIRNSNTIGRRDGDNDDGYHYFGIIDDDEDSRYYAGILTTTNLGAPLTAPVDGAPTTAIWQGHASFGVVASAKNVPTEFYLNFAAGTIEFANEAGNGADTATVGISSSNLTGVQLTLNGKFGVGATDANGTLSLGQLGGHMLASSIDKGKTELPVTGLIGQDGVVGVFVHPLGTSAGGFVARPTR